jgi:hypothetical protein
MATLGGVITQGFGLREADIGKGIILHVQDNGEPSASEPEARGPDMFRALLVPTPPASCPAPIQPTNIHDGNIIVHDGTP